LKFASILSPAPETSWFHFLPVSVDKKCFCGVNGLLGLASLVGFSSGRTSVIFVGCPFAGEGIKKGVRAIAEMRLRNTSFIFPQPPSFGEVARALYKTFSESSPFS
jgi:hypothetical protein